MFDFPLHVFFVHFPVALIVIAVICDLRARFSGQPDLHAVGYRLTLWAAAGSVVAIVTGMEIVGNLIKTAPGAAHAGVGLAGGFIVIIFAALRYSYKARSDAWQEYYPASWLVLEIMAGLTILAAAVMGHGLVFG